MDKICKEASDIFYIPKNLFYNFNLVSKIFESNNVFLEFAVPMLISGLGQFKFTSNSIQGLYYWGLQLNLVNDYFKVKHFAHPFKLSHYSSIEKRQKICEFFIQDKLNFL